MSDIQKVLKTLEMSEAIAERCVLTCVDCGNLNEHIYNLNQRIAELESKQRWISVSERLPEKSGTYLVWYKHYLEMANFDWISTKWQICYTNWITDIDYWMPLPVPPIMYGKVCEE